QLVAQRHGGRFPRSERDLLELPGVGPYTAAAIAAIAYGEPCVAVDGNVERVMTRFEAVAEPTPRAKAAVKAAATRLLPPARPGDFLQALMDLGATVCTPRAPDCASCPLARDCAALRLGTPTAFPVKPAKPERPRRRGAAFVLRAGDRVLLRRRPEKGLLGGMSEFPTTPLDGDFPVLGEACEGSPARLAAVAYYAPTRAAWREAPGPVRHVFTHFLLELCVFVARAPMPEAIPGCRWVDEAELAQEPLPTVMRKAALRAGLRLG
ncbi:MAG TPA: NUDIX domain-containing protein, partial [Methylocystis sp.]|nr:NUDIX domain-containing protein [Methylocystis sp.]